MAMYGNLDVAKAGMLDGLDHDFIHKRADVAFKFGSAVMVDAGNETDAFAPDSTDASLKFQGIAIHTYYADNLVEGEYPANHSLPVCTAGEVWVKVRDEADIANLDANVVDLVGDADYGLFTSVASTDTYDNVGVFTSNAVEVETGVFLASVRIDGLV